MAGQAANAKPRQGNSDEHPEFGAAEGRADVQGRLRVPSCQLRGRLY